MVYGDNYGGVDDKKALLHSKRQDIYLNKKENTIKGGYLVEIVSSDGKKFIQEVLDNHVVEEETDHDKIGTWGFDFNFLDKDDKGVVREWPSEFPHLLILINIWHGYCKTQLKRMNMKVDEDNVK